MKSRQVRGREILGSRVLAAELGKSRQVPRKPISEEKNKMGMRFLASFKKTCSFEDWLKLVDSLKPQMDKHGLKLIFATESEDGTSIYDVGEAATMEGVEAFLSDPEVRQMRVDAGVDIDSQEVISAVGKFNVF